MDGFQLIFHRDHGPDWDRAASYIERVNDALAQGDRQWLGTVLGAFLPDGVCDPTPYLGADGIAPAVLDRARAVIDQALTGSHPAVRRTPIGSLVLLEAADESAADADLLHAWNTGVLPAARARVPSEDL